MSQFVRHRQLRQSPEFRRAVRETWLSPSDFIAPFFVTHGSGVKKPIASMPGQAQLSINNLLKEAKKAHDLGLAGVILFGIPKQKNSAGSEAYAATGIVQQAARALKKKFPKLIVITDLCFCEYTDHGHCGVIKKSPGGTWDVDNDATLELIRKTAVVQAKAGADFVAPSGMMDGAVAAIRDEFQKKKIKNTGILAYSAKYASVFYGPFRDAAESTPKFGDRRTYQMDPANAREALRELRADVFQGADMVMVKPALSYLDIIARIRPELDVPLVAYNVSGEYAMVKAAERLGWLDGAGQLRAALEILTSIKRAGADLIITYHALEAAAYLKSHDIA